MQKVILAITDGIGINPSEHFNAFAAAKKPTYERLDREALKCRLATSGLAVGLPEGQMGNSEVGHMCLGSGRVIFQSLVKIDRAIADGSIVRQPAMAQLLERVRKGARVHVFGLYSDGGVHASFEHFNACIRLLLAASKEQAAASSVLADAQTCAQDTQETCMQSAQETCANKAQVFAHLITDGRDVLPKSALDFIANNAPASRPASIAGRFYAMDRDNNLDRTEAYIRMLSAACEKDMSAKQVLLDAYAAGITDEFILPQKLQIGADIRKGDLALVINFRADRARQLASALRDFGLEVSCMCEYDAALKLPVIFEPESVPDCLAEVISRAKMRQLHTSETEKYAHVSFFFNGGREEPFDQEQRVLVPSTGAKSYAQTPKMSAAAITDVVCEGIKNGVEFIVLNYANGDMVGHTGDYEAAVAAVEEVDTQLGRLLSAASTEGYAVLITSDHGNCEQMRGEDNQMLTNHTTFDVAAWLWGAKRAVALRDGTLANVAATVLQLLQLQVPEIMQPSLISKLAD